MAYDEYLEDRVNRVFKEKKVDFLSKKMMGGLCYMVDDKMCVGIVKGELMARIGPEVYEETLKRPGAKEMNFTGRAMKGYIFVDAEGIDMDEDLEHYIQLAIDFNPLAKASKKKKSKSSGCSKQLNYLSTKRK